MKYDTGTGICIPLNSQATLVNKEVTQMNRDSPSLSGGQNLPSMTPQYRVVLPLGRPLIIEAKETLRDNTLTWWSQNKPAVADIGFSCQKVNLLPWK
jgi:hypothetical protein